MVEGSSKRENSNVFRSSSAAVWTQCSFAHSMDITRNRYEKTKSQIEGIAAHSLAESELRGETKYNPPIDIDISRLKPQADEYASLVRRMANGSKLHIEERLRYSSKNLVLTGVVDCWFVRDNVLHVIEYKNGGYIVPIVDNWQMLCYAALIRYANPSFNDALSSAQFTIFQPNVYKGPPIRGLSVPITELDKAFSHILSAMEASVSGGLAKSGSHCFGCSGKVGCRVFGASVSKAIEFSDEPVFYDIPNSELSPYYKLLLRSEERIRDMRKSVGTLIEHKIKKGEKFSGLYLGSSGSREIWAFSYEDIISLATRRSMDLSKKVLLTVREAKKKGHDISDFTERVPYEKTLKIEEEK